MVLLFYNGLLFPKMKLLTEYFSFLENLLIEELIDEEHKTNYSFTLKNRTDLLQKLNKKY